MCLLRTLGSVKCYDKIQMLEVGLRFGQRTKCLEKVCNDLFECLINQGSFFKHLTRTHQSMKYLEKVQVLDQGD
jgi:hypothetical protein